ncbi:large ribosomal subunit protein bL17m isoform X4 [Ovis aries]|uniref:large ribosomal subunit protein bL17m isoform X4 n=1 Tax=Ovis aries TaxID=9940 RepID=UPI0029525ECF|nr:large ribosomal subunit protein bL17m isoform X4 [Ovis aries]
MHLLTTLSSFMKLEASGDGKPLLKEPAGSAFLTAVVKELRSRLEISESKLPDSGKEPALLSCSSLWSKLKTGAWPQGGRSFRRWEVTSERKPTGSVFLTAVVVAKVLELQHQSFQKIDELHQKLQCMQHWSTERAQFFSTTTPDHMLHNQCFRS